jgi:hypothetical protein
MGLFFSNAGAHERLVIYTALNVHHPQDNPMNDLGIQHWFIIFGIKIKPIVFTVKYFLIMEV